MDELRVSCLQMNVVPNDPSANIAKARALLAELLSGGEQPDILILPELWTKPFDPARFPQEPVSCENSEEALQLVCDACGEACLYAIAGSLPWPTENGLAVRSWLVDDCGTRADYYDKTHLFAASGESRAFTAGDTPLFFELGSCKCSVLTCYDIRFPEFARSLALGGADVFFVNAAWPVHRTDTWEPLLRALALQNQCYVVACNCTGRSGDLDFCGNSLVVSPWGDVVASAGMEERILFATLDISEVYKCRKLIPLLHDRRPSLYQIF